LIKGTEPLGVDKAVIVELDPSTCSWFNPENLPTLKQMFSGSFNRI